MKLNRKNLFLASTATITLTLSTPSLHAQDGTWAVDADGNWTDATNWTGNITANGTDFTATLNNITANRTITLDANQTVGNITASDTTHNFTISGASTLTLAVTAGTPTISVPTSGRVLTIGSVIDGSSGFSKIGAGGLILSGNNIYTGETTLSTPSGTSVVSTLTISNNNALGSTTGGTTIIGSHTTGNGNSLILSNGITVTGETLTLDSGGNATTTGYRSTMIVAADGNATWDGNVVVNGNATQQLALFINGSLSNLTVGGSSADTITLNRPLALRGAAGNGTINSTISGTGILGKADAGNWTLTAANTHTGNTTISSTGTLVLANTLAVGNSTLEISATGGGLAFGSPTDFTVGGLSAASAGVGKNIALVNSGNASVALSVGNNNANTTYAGVLSGTGGSLTKIGNGTLILTGGNTFTGNTTISSGTLQIGAANTTGSIANTTSVTNNAALVFNRSNDFSSTYPISGNGTVEKLGAGTLTLSGNNTYTGGTTVTAGRLQPTLATALADYNVLNKVVFNGGTVVTVMGDGNSTGWSTAQVDTLLAFGNKTSGALGIDTTSGNLTFAPTNFSGGIGLTKLGANSTLTLSGSNTYTGNTTVSAGTLRLENTGALGSSGLITASQNSRLEIATDSPYAGPNVLTGGATFVSDKFTANTTGVTHVLGTFQGQGTSNFIAGSNVNVGNSTPALQFSTGNHTGGSGNNLLLNATTANVIFTGGISGGNTGNGTLTLGGTSAGNRIDGDIVNGLRNGTVGMIVTKSGNSTWTLSGNNTYTGPTTVSDGTLLVNGNQSAANGTVSVAANATLGGNGTLGGATTVSGNLAPGNGIGQITFTGGLTTGNLTDSSLKYELGANTTAGATYDTVVTNALDIGTTLDFPDFQFTGTPAAGTYTLISSGNTTGTLGGNLTGPIGAFTGTLSKPGNDIILTVASSGSAYSTWSGGAGFYADANGDGVPNGMTWLLGGANTTSNGLALLPAPVVSGGNMTLSFKTPALIAPAQLLFEYGTNLVTWSTPAVPVPLVSGNFTNGTFTVTPGNATTNNVILTVNGNASVGGKLFGRFNSKEN